MNVDACEHALAESKWRIRRRWLSAHWNNFLSVPPTFVAPAFGMIRYATYFALAMLANWGWGYLFLIGFCWQTWRFLRRLNRYIEIRVYLKAGMTPPPPSPLPRIVIGD